MDKEHIVTIISSLLGGGVLMKVVDLIMSRRKATAEARGEEVKGELQIVAVAQDYLSTLREEVDRLSLRLEKSDARIDALITQNHELRRQMGEFRSEIERLEYENTVLERRCTQLEAENEKLRHQIENKALP
jgi:chromosome segregation ATPase